jgi:serine/threonine-protein phosphatase 6 regulatory ankyrin repeat subunit A/serine/threonine-protein phosphatase 6 regulatory ankyrin repeat subunit B
MNSNEDLQKALFDAIEANDLEAVERCVEQGADVNVKNNVGRLSLYEAAGNSSVEILKYLVLQGAKVNREDTTVSAIWDYRSFLMSWIGGVTLLHTAAAGNPNVEMVKYLVSQGTDVNAKNEHGQTPLHYAACWNPNVEVLKYLVSQGADVSAKDKRGGEPLHYAISGNCNVVAMLEFLVSHGADINAKTIQGETLLHFADLWSDSGVEILEYCVSQGADVNATIRGKTPLYIAALRRKNNPNMKVLKCLIALGTDVNVKDNSGMSLLDITVHPEVVDILLVAGAEPTRWRNRFLKNYVRLSATEQQKLLDTFPPTLRKYAESVIGRYEAIKVKLLRFVERFVVEHGNKFPKFAVKHAPKELLRLIMTHWRGRTFDSYLIKPAVNVFYGKAEVPAFSNEEEKGE